MKQKLLLLFSGLLLAAVAPNAQAASIVVGISDSNIGSGVNDTFFSNLFSGDDVYGRTSTTDWTLDNWSFRIGANGGNFTSGALSSSTLADKEWLALSTNDPFSSGELSLVNTFVNGGGNLIIIGEGPAYNDINNHANSVLTAIGSTMAFNVGGTQSSPPWIISSDPLMAGVSSFSGNYVGGISGGTPLVTASSPEGQVAVAYESLTTSSVPESSNSFALLAIAFAGIIGLAGAIRKQTAATIA